jgi:hypothetical protein
MRTTAPITPFLPCARGAVGFFVPPLGPAAWPLEGAISVTIFHDGVAKLWLSANLLLIPPSSHFSAARSFICVCVYAYVYAW